MCSALGELSAALDEPHDFMITAVKRWSDHVVHTGIDDRKLFAAGFLDVKDAAKDQARVEQSAWFKQDTQSRSR
jgi:hypothetical protein